MPLFGSRGAASVTGFGGLAKLGYLLRNSLRFRSGASAYLNRTPASASNRKTFTYSFWMKYSISSQYSVLFSAQNSGGGDQDALYVDNVTYSQSMVIRLDSITGIGLATTQVFRDPSAWYHIVMAMDTTQATAANRLKLYVNGSEITSFITDGRSSITQNSDMNGWNTNRIHLIGSQAQSYPAYTHNGYMTEINFVDGQALTPSSFGKTDSATGQWIPKKFGGAYGTNGFYLNFTDASNTTATTLGKDSSGNGNNWTPNNFSITAGATYDSMVDVPTLTSATTANYCVINTTTTQPTGWQVASAFSNGGLTSTIASAASDGPAYGTIALPRSGKWYWEVTITDSTVPGAIGVSESSMARPDGTGPICRMLYSGGGSVVSFAYDGTNLTGSYTFFGNATIGVACDMDNGKLFVSVNGTYVNSGNPSAGTGAIFTDLLSASPGGGSWLPMSFGYNGHVHHHNYGQRPFAYTPPSGFKNLNTFNLP